MAPPPERRLRLQLQGLVQGVGFRPHVVRLATTLGLSGWVANGHQGVVMELQGEHSALEHLLAQLLEAPPSRARIDQHQRRWIPLSPTRPLGSRLTHPGPRPQATAPPRPCRGPTWRSATPAWRNWAIRATAATATPSSAAPPAAPAMPSSGNCRLSGTTPAWRPFPSAPSASGSTAIPATAASTPRRSAARNAGPSCAGTAQPSAWRPPSPPPSPACAVGDCWPSRGWGAFSCWPGPIKSRRCGNAAGARGAPTSPWPCWPAAHG